jgi:vancomycin resistance protein YoaR
MIKILQRIINNKWVRLSTAVIVGLGLIFLLVFVVNWGMSNSYREKLMSEGTFIEGVRISGVDVSGRTMAEAKEDVIVQARKLLKKTVVRFRVGDTVYRLTGSQLGTLIDYEAVMEQAMLCGREGSLLSDLMAKHKARKEGISFELDVVLDESVLESTIKEMSTTFNSTVQDAQMIVDISKTASTLNVQSQIYAADSVVGRVVDIKALIDSIMVAVEQDCTGRTITALWQETQPQSVDKEAIMANCQLIGTYTTSLSGADTAVLNNVWKASGQLSGLQIKPGESISFLALMGEMTEEAGWQTASVIGADSMAEEMGGGASQVASTLYAALLQAEVRVDTLQHHAWAPEYITAGLDARISGVENLDLVFTNPYETVLYVLVNCDGSKEEKVTVEIYGAPLEYTVEISTDKIMDAEPLAEAEVTVDETQETGFSEWNKPRKNWVKIDVWKVRKDKVTGEQIDSKIYIGEAEYPALAGVQVVGPAAEEVPMQEGAEVPGEGQTTDPAGAEGQQTEGQEA